MTSTPTPRISAFIICCNEERNIRRCLESLRWCDEIVVVDSGSTDGTLAICREFTDQIFERPWPGFVAQKRYALEQCRGEWVLNLDADEEVSPELREEIVGLLAAGTQRSGFYLNRVVFYLGRWWRRGGWYPEYRLRLCRRTATTWGGADPHEKAEVRGETARLTAELRHYTYTDMTHQIRSLNNFSQTAAKTLYARGEKWTLARMLARPVIRFFKFFVVKRGYREGMPGFIVAVLEAHYVFLKYAKVWEIEHSERRKP